MPRYTLSYDGTKAVLHRHETKTLAQIRDLVVGHAPLAAVRHAVRLYIEGQDPCSEIRKRWYNADEQGCIAIENGSTEVYVEPTDEEPGGWQVQDVPANANLWLARYRGVDVDEAIVEPEHVVTDPDIDAFFSAKHSESGVEGGSYILWRTIGDLLQRIDETTQEAIKAAAPALWNRFMSLTRVFLADPEYVNAIASLLAASVITQQQHDDLLSYDDPSQ